MAVFSEVHLDHETTFANLRAIFQGYCDADFLPLVLVLCGNFSSTPVEADADQLERYKEGFAQLGDVLLRFPRLLDETHLVLVPGPDDPVATPLLPRARLPAPLVERLERRLPRAFCAERLHWMSNPCRIVYFTQELVVFRDDIMSKMLRSALPLRHELSEGDLQKFVRVCRPADAAACLHAAGPGAPVPAPAAGAPGALGVRPRPPAIPHAQCGRCAVRCCSGWADLLADLGRPVRAVCAHVRGVPCGEPGLLPRGRVWLGDLLPCHRADRAQVRTTMGTRVHRSELPRGW